MNRILFLVIGEENTINEDTKASITKAFGKEDAVVYIKYKDDGHSLYYKLKDSCNNHINDVNNFNYVCLIPNGSLINANAKLIFNEAYYDNNEDDRITTYLPLQIYQLKDDMTVVLNKHVWNSLIAMEPGVLDGELSLQQIDSTIFGAFIPVSIFFDESNYNTDLKYYQHYYILNSISNADKSLVLGIPKIILTTLNFDLVLDNISQEEKKENFLLARNKWENIKRKDLVKS